MYCLPCAVVGLRVLYCELFGTQSQYEWGGASRATPTRPMVLQRIEKSLQRDSYDSADSRVERFF